MTKEEYDVNNLVSFENTVLLECICGTLAIQIGNTAAGGQMVAHFAQILKKEKYSNREITIVLSHLHNQLRRLFSSTF